MTKLRVALDYRPALLLKSGIGRYVRELTAELKQRDDLELVLFASFWRGQQAAFAAASKLDPEWQQGVEVVAQRIPARLYNGVASRCGFGIEKLLPPVDLFHHTDFIATPFVGAPQVATIYDLSFLAAENFHEAQDIAKLRSVTNYLTQRAAGILTISAASCADLVKHCNLATEKITVTPLAASSAFFELQAKRAKKIAARDLGETFLVLGTVEPRKNHQRILAAFDQLLDDPTYSEVKMEWIGRAGWCNDEVLAALAQKKYRGRVHWRGEVSESELLTSMTNARAMLYPSLLEGFGLPLIEAMAAGIPLLTSNRGAMAEVAGDAAILVDPQDTAAIAEGMKLLWDSKTLCLDLSARAKVRAKDFSWALCAEQTVAAYCRALNGGA